MATQRIVTNAILVAGLVAVSWAGVGRAQPGQEITQPSLAELARKAREEKQKEAPAKVYTNETLPKGGGGISEVGPEPTEGTAGGASTRPSAKHDRKYFQTRMAELQHRLEIHERELEVLQQKSSISSLQYYPNPNQALRQQYSRADINKLNEQIEEKQKEIAADKQAIADLEAELGRDGGDPGWLRGVPAKAPAPEAAPAPPSTPEEWQSQLGAARERFAKAKEEQQLAEDELNLLLSRQAHEANGAALGSEIEAKRAELEAKRAAVEDARRALDQLERQFRETQGQANPPSSDEPKQ